MVRFPCGLSKCLLLRSFSHQLDPAVIVSVLRPRYVQYRKSHSILKYSTYGDPPDKSPPVEAQRAAPQVQISEPKTPNMEPKVEEPKAEPEPKPAEPKTVNMIKEAVSKAVKKRLRVDLTATSVERNFITPAKAMSDFCLRPKDLESLRATKRRSPYENEPPISVYWRKDVEAKALEVWGSKENLMKELLNRELERKFYVQSVFSNKRRLRDYRRELNQQAGIAIGSVTEGLRGSSGKVVLTAVAINGCNFLFKVLAWLYTGSHSMFSEAIHSMADTINQLILAYGIHKSVQRADALHPYGYTNMKYVASLISGVGIFCVGAGLSVYHGIQGLLHPQPIEPFFWAYCILAGSLVSEGRLDRLYVIPHKIRNVE